jgi:hypothetical protein
VACYESLEPAEEKISVLMQVKDTQSFVTLGDNLEPSQVDEIMEVIHANRDAFSLQGEIGCTNLVQHDIELVEGALPSSEPLRRRPQAHKEETRRQIKEMISKGIIEESASPWAAAYVLAKKKGGALRLCVDFRKLNDVTKKCKYPLPNVDDCVETLAGKRYFSKLDMASGFWQLPLTERARELTAFRTEDGHYQFTRMPFGLTNAPASFQRLVNILFAGLKGLNLQLFIDDLCLATSTWREHLVLLAKIFQLLIKANLKLNINKCSFGTSKVVFLGHEIAQDGIRQDPEKLAAIRDLKAPSNLRELRGVLGLMNYYRRFVPGYALLAEPLTRLLRKGVEFNWTPQQDQAFAKIIEELLKNGTLSHFDHEKPTALKTDACKLGIAAILLQQVDEDWRIVCCCSRTLTPAELNYGVTELEALAVVYAVDKLRHFLLGKRFRIITDHCALCSIFKNPSSSARLNRWRLVLQEFQFDVVYTRGSMHSDVDCLSRAPIADEVDDLLDNKILAVFRRTQHVGATVLVIPIDHDSWREALVEDEEAKQFMTKAKHRRDGFKLHQGLLYKSNRLYVPRLKRDDMILLAHSGTIAGHGGIKVTMAKLDAFWWPSLSRDVKLAVENCQECQMQKVPRHPPQGQMHCHVAHSPLETWAIDCLGPLPTTMSGKRHCAVAVDVFCRFVMTKAIKDVRASSLAKFVADCMGRFGVPSRILTDNAPTFANQQFDALAERFKFHHMKSTPHHHQGNAVAERYIQVVQEKLRLVLGNDTEDWEEALPQATIAINTSLCSTTNLTPFELMFGRKHPVAGFREVSDVSEDQRLAIARQSQSKAASKVRYDQAHTDVQFESGTLVLIRRMGRISKISARFEGPYEVVSRNKDIYQVRSQHSNKVLERHVKDMKPYRALVCLLFLTSQVHFAEQIVVFERASPVLWTEARQYVSRGIVDFKVQINYASPCGEVIPKIVTLPKQVMVDAIAMCEKVFRDQVTQRVAQYPTFLPNGQMAAVVPAVLDPSQRGYQAPLRYQAYPTGQPRLAPGISPAPSYQHVVLKQSPRVKRDMGLSTAFVTASVVSSVVNTVLNKIWDHEALEELRDANGKIEEELHRQIKAINATELMLEAVEKAVINQATMISHNVADIRQMQLAYPELTVVMSHIIANAATLGAGLDRLRASFRAKRPDLPLLASMTNSLIFDEVEPESIYRQTVRALSPRPNVLQLAFRARTRDAQARVYQVETFRFWNNLDKEVPSQLEYSGPGYLVYNFTNQCVKAIADPKNDWVNVRCYNASYSDPALAKWSAVNTAEDPWSQPAHPLVKESWPFVYVYCFTLNITYRGEVAECPPFVFRVNASEPFATADYEYSPSAVELTAQSNIVIDEVALIHFRNFTQVINDNHLIKTLIQARRNLTKANEELFAFKFGSGHGMSYPVLLILVNAGYLMGLGALFYFQRRQSEASKRRHHEVLASVVDTTYGQRLYETLRHKRGSERPVTTTIINIPTTTQPIPDRGPRGESGDVVSRM